MLAVNTAASPYPVFPLGAAVIVNALRKRGHETRFFDLLIALKDADLECSGLEDISFDQRTEQIKRQLAECLAEFKPECIGISLRNIESVDFFTYQETWSLNRLKRITAFLRQSCKELSLSAPIVLGGPGFSLLPDVIREHTGADIGITGNGEEAFPALLERLQAGLPLPEAPVIHGAPWAKEARANISGAFYDGLAQKYQALGGLIGVQSRRGCPYSCAYCCYPMLEGRTVAARPVEAVLAEITHLYEQCGVTEIAFADAVFNDPSGQWRELVAALDKSGPPVGWTAFFQPCGLEKGDFALLKKSGIIGIEFGTDASSNATLRGLKKPFAMEQVIALQRLCAQAEIPAAHYIIFGGPGETLATVDEGLANLKQLEHCVVLACAGLSIHPGTELHRLALREGLVDAEEDFLYPRYYFAPGLDKDEMIALIKSSFGKRRDRIFPPSAADKKLAALRRFGQRGILWDTLISFPARAFSL